MIQECNKKIKELKILIVPQKEAFKIFFGKTDSFERKYATLFRGTIGIYIPFKNHDSTYLESERIKKGCIIGTIELIDCKKNIVNGATAFNYFFSKAELIEPFPIAPPKGAIVWWTLSNVKLQEVVKTIPSEIIPLKKV